MKIDILVIVAHPDDAELSCGGTIAMQVAAGNKVGVIDLTQGELGSRGTVQTRYQEAEKASQILGLSVRENLGFADGFFVNDQAHQLQVIKKIRQYQPQIVITNAKTDRHPDHAKAGELVETACFLAGLVKIDTQQATWRPENIYHVIQSDYIKPDFVVDISDFWETKMQSVLAYQTQFYTPNQNTDEPQTFISSENFARFLEARAREFGQAIRCKYGEGFTSRKFIGIKNIFDLL